VEIITAAVGTTVQYNLGTNTAGIANASCWGAALDLTQAPTPSANPPIPGPICLGGSNSVYTPLMSAPKMFPNGGTIDLTASTISALTSNATVIVYALVVSLTF
jgi:hypothetical protein